MCLFMKQVTFNEEIYWVLCRAGPPTPTFLHSKKEKGKQRKKEKVSKQKLLKDCHQGLTILERLHYFSVFHGPFTLKFIFPALVWSIKLKQEFNEKCGYKYLSDTKFGDHDYIMLPNCKSPLRQNKTVCDHYRLLEFCVVANNFLFKINGDINKKNMNFTIKAITDFLF